MNCLEGRFVFKKLIDGLEGWYMNLSIVSASSCHERTFAVEIKNRLLESSLPFTSSSLFIHTHRQKHTHILLQAVQSGVRHILKRGKRQEWPHFYVHSVCTVSSESVRPQLL